MATPNTLVLTGYGINCDEETKFAFEQAGANADIVHINDLIDKHKKLSDYQILAFPGGFSYGDDTGSGLAFANKVRYNLREELKEFVEADHLAIGICNGFQVMVNLGLLPGTKEYGTQEVALTHNDSARYVCRWVDLEFKGDSPWVKNIGSISVPIAHGEGRFFADDDTLNKLHEKGLVSACYTQGPASMYQRLDANPNGSLDNIASITDPSGRLIGMMPHPERAIDVTQTPYWPLMKERFKRQGQELPKEADGLLIFKNAVNYFK